MSHAVDGTYIKAQQDKMVNSSLCKKASVDTYFNVMEVNLIIYNDDVIATIDMWCKCWFVFTT